MKEAHEILTVKLERDDRLKLYSQITERMKEKGYDPMRWDSMHLGFHLPAEWPVDEKCQPTLAQLTVIAVKLEMDLEITRLNLYPRKKDDGKE